MVFDVIELKKRLMKDGIDSKVCDEMLWLQEAYMYRLNIINLDYEDLFYTKFRIETYRKLLRMKDDFTIYDPHFLEEAFVEVLKCERKEATAFTQRENEMLVEIGAI